MYPTGQYCHFDLGWEAINGRHVLIGNGCLYRLMLPSLWWERSKDQVVLHSDDFAALLAAVSCFRLFSSFAPLSFWRSNPDSRDDGTARTASICHFTLVSLDKKPTCLRKGTIICVILTSLSQQAADSGIRLWRSTLFQLFKSLSSLSSRDSRHKNLQRKVKIEESWWMPLWMKIKDGNKWQNSDGL